MYLYIGCVCTGHHPRPRFSLEYPLPLPVSPLIYGKKGGLNRGDNAVNKIFPVFFQKLTFTPILEKKIFGKFLEIWTL